LDASSERDQPRPAGSAERLRRLWSGPIFGGVGLVVVMVLANGLGLVADTTHAAKPADTAKLPTTGALPTGSDPVRSATLAAKLRSLILAQHFDEVLDTTPPDGSTGPAPIHQSPSLDVSLIELTPGGRPRATADVLVGPHFPKGKIVPVGQPDAGVRWRQWDDEIWDVDGGRAAKLLLPGERAGSNPIDFMVPYPASVLKLMVAFGILQLVDAGTLTLDETYDYRPMTASVSCGPTRTATVTQFFDEMITVSKNESACALISLLHKRDAVDPLNATFARLGLGMLQLKGTDTDTGGHWVSGVAMNALDTSKLLLLVAGGPGILWRAPDGYAVTRNVLSASSRKYFLGKLADQGLNQVLSTTNRCGRAYPAAGIPQLTPARWVDPVTGTMTVDGRAFGQDVRPCNAAAQVAFAHKTGLSDTSGGDAGIVTSLPGNPKRTYIVTVFSNLGFRYVDPTRPDDPAGIYPVQYTEKLAKLGLAIDALMTR
jgi:beta-lactamase class A